MALPASGKISLGDVNVELGNPLTSQISMGSTIVRNLYGISIGSIRLGADGYGKSNHIPFSTKITFTTNTSWQVPTGLGITAIRVKMWGASGGSRQIGSNTPTGGCGGYSQADISIDPGSNLLVAVGGGGGITIPAIGGTNGGGGQSGALEASAGGGYSGIFLNNTASQANALIVAGGGGGAGIQSNANGCGIGGGGGNTLGGEGGGGPTYNIALQGGTGISGTAGGGGGYTGGAAGPSTSLSGGRGGSGYLITGSINRISINGSTGTYGAATNAPNNADVDYVSNKANISGVNTSGNPGYVVIYY